MQINDEAMNTALANQLQIDEICRHKWIESEKAGRDLGVLAVIDWINNHAAEWRRELNENLFDKEDE